MALPKAAQKQIKAAEKLHNEVYGPKDEPVAEPVVGEPVIEPVAEPVTEPVVEVAPPTAVESESIEITSGKPDDWEHKYKTLQGMYNAEVPKFSKKAKSLEDENSSLRAILASLEDVNSNPAPAAAPVEMEEPLINDNEIEEYGAELIDVMKRAARESIQPELVKLRTENEQLRGSLGTVSKTMGESARKSVYGSLAESVPNWQEINSDAAFLSWLTQLDVFSGQPRQELLSQAFEHNDAQRVIAFFKSYLDETAVVQPATEDPAPAVSPPPVNPSALVAPGKAKAATSSASTQESGKRIWTQTEIAAFYSQVRRGLFKENEADKRAIEKDIIDAANTGRIR